jgi:hypothetical protein
MCGEGKEKKLHSIIDSSRVTGIYFVFVILNACSITIEENPPFGSWGLPTQQKPPPSLYSIRGKYVH